MPPGHFDVLGTFQFDDSTDCLTFRTRHILGYLFVAQFDNVAGKRLDLKYGKHPERKVAEIVIDNTEKRNLTPKRLHVHRPAVKQRFGSLLG